MLKQLHELRGLISIDLIARINVRERVDHDRYRLDLDGIGQDSLEQVRRPDDVLVIGDA